MKKILSALLALMILVPSASAHQFWHLYEVHLPCSLGLQPGGVTGNNWEYKIRYCLVFDHHELTDPNGNTKMMIDIWVHCLKAQKRECLDPPGSWASAGSCSSMEGKHFVVDAATDHAVEIGHITGDIWDYEWFTNFPCVNWGFEPDDLGYTYDGHAAHTWGGWYASNRDLSKGSQIAGTGDTSYPTGWVTSSQQAWDDPETDAGKSGDSLPDCSF